MIATIKFIVLGWKFRGVKSVRQYSFSLHVPTVVLVSFLLVVWEWSLLFVTLYLSHPGHSGKLTEEFAKTNYPCKKQARIWSTNAWVKGFLVEVPCLPFPLHFGGDIILIVMKLCLFYFSFQDLANVF